MTEEKSGNQPAHKVRIGRVNVPVWENEITLKTGEKKKILNIGIPQVQYKADDGSYKDSNSIRQNEVLDMQTALQKAWEWCKLEQE